MNLLLLVFLAVLLLFIGYFLYGSILSRILKLNRDAITPAHQYSDNKDFVPAGRFYLLGQHLSAIAAAGPIVGPILAGLWFGWAPTILWIILGGILIGGVHDLSTLVASVRHQGKSIAEVIRVNMHRRPYILFLLFLWFSLVYIITAFTDITASTFADEASGAAVASSSMMYLGLAVIMGVVIKRFRLSVRAATFLFLPLIFVCIYLGPIMPFSMPAVFGGSVRTTWDIILLSYCFVAAVVPVWLLLQPRGYLGGFFLTFTVLLSFLGMLIGNFTQNFLIQYPAFKGWLNPYGLPLFPLLFTTVACGACSGFHAIVSSGTTSKQLSKETDAKLVGYGGMLFESFVAVISLSTLLILSTARAKELQDPSQIFANGISIFLGGLGVNRQFAFNFALLAFATFVYDTLDVATRLGRYVFQELTGWKNRFSTYGATAITLILPFIFVTRRLVDADGNAIPAWRLFWTIFGGSNQLLAALALLGITVWMFKNRMRYLFALLPSMFMMLTAITSLYFILRPGIFNPMGMTGLILLVLALLLIIEGLLSLRGGRRPTKQSKNEIASPLRGSQ